MAGSEAVVQFARVGTVMIPPAKVTVLATTVQVEVEAVVDVPVEAR